MRKRLLSFVINEPHKTYESLMLLLVLFSCFISSSPQTFISRFKDTLSNINIYGSLNEKTYNVDSNFLNNVQIENLDSGHLHIDLNSGNVENGNLSENKHLIKIHGNYSNDFDDKRNYNSSWWSDISREIAELLSSINDCPGWKFRCFYNETERSKSKFARYRRRECECDSSCEAYGECCIDKVATLSRHEKFSFKNRMFCGLLSKKDEGKGVYMIGDCLPEMRGNFEEQLCFRKVEEESYGVILDIPVLSLETNITYINYYCALCNNDSSSLLQMDFSLSCSPKHLSDDDANMTLNEFLLEAKYKPRDRTYERKRPANDGNEAELVVGNPRVSLADKVNGYTRNARALRFQPSPILPLTQICQVRVNQYQNVKSYASLYGSKICTPSQEVCSVKPDDKRITCTRQVSECDSTWPVSSDFEKCQLYSLKVHDKSKNIIYKNPHCAKCNFASLSTNQFSCTDLKTFTRPTLYAASPRFRKPTFSILFQIPNLSPRKCSKRDEIWSPFDDQCSKIICGVGRILRKGKCVKSEYKNYESNVPKRSFLLKNCPTVAVSNFTLYDNDSVYYYNGNKLYEKGEYELFNDSVILICAQNKFYFKKNFLFSYYTTVAVLSISLVCLVFHMSLYFCYSRLRTWHGRNLLYLCFSLFIAQFLFLTGTTATEHFGFCVFMAVCIHYFWLASFFWMNVLSIDVWRTFKTKFSHNSNTRKVFLLYNLYSWGTPFVIVMLSLTLDMTMNDSKFKPNYAGFDEAELCWINNKIGLLCFFLLPVAIIITENLILFTITSYKIYSQSKETRFAKMKSQSVKVVKERNLSEEEKKKLRKQEKASKNNKIRFILYLKLGILQGLTWVFGFLASYVDSSICWSIFTILNGLQGAAIVLCFDVKKWILDSVWRNISIVSLGSKFSKSTKTTPFENDLVKEKSSREEFKKIEKKSSCNKRKSFIKAKESVKSSSFYKSSQKYKSFTGPSSENVSSDSGVGFKNDEKYSENSKAFDITEDTYMKETDTYALKSCQ